MKIINWTLRFSFLIKNNKFSYWKLLSLVILIVNVISKSYGADLVCDKEPLAKRDACKAVLTAQTAQPFSFKIASVREGKGYALCERLRANIE